MSVIVTEAGFVADAFAGREPLALDALLSGAPLPDEALVVDFPNDRAPAELGPWLDRLALVRVAFPAYGDGRGFSIARELRTLGYAGRLRAVGPLIADQLRWALKVGFDEVEVPDALAARQPEEQWHLRPQGSYQDRLTS